MNDSQIQEKLSLSRIKAINLMPYFAKILLLLKPVPVPGLETFAVDDGWRLYYDPACVEKWTLDELAAVWLHEVGHVYRSHSQRFGNLQVPKSQANQWNKAADATINSELRDAGILLPDADARYYAVPDICPGWNKKKTTEQLFRALQEHEGVENNAPSGGKESAPNDSQGESPSEHNDMNDSSHEDDTENQKGNETSQESETTGNTKNGDSSKVEAPSDSSTQESEEGLELDGDGDGDGDDSFRPCGSGVGHEPAPYELPQDDLKNPGMERADSETVIQSTAQDIKQFESYNPGTVPGGIMRDTDDILKPKVSWSQHLKVKISRNIAAGSAKSMPSYKRPARRSQYSGKIILPGKYGEYQPNVFVILDSSGSMSSKDLARGLSEITGILKKVRGKLFFTSVDARSSVVQEVRKIEDIEIVGGGGTDMRIGLKVAAKHNPKPDIIIVITDGGTPWSTKPEPEAPQATYIAVIVKQSGSGTDRLRGVPKFIQQIVVEA